jgi:hypothetical protein
LQGLTGRYAWSYNRRHGRRGHVFESRYHGVIVRSQRHLLELVRYLALNPVRAGACAVPEDWVWSSYRATAGLEEAPSFLTVGWILAQFAVSHATACLRYRAHVAEGIARRTVPPPPLEASNGAWERSSARIREPSASQGAIPALQTRR